MSVLLKSPLFGTPHLDTPLFGAEGEAVVVVVTPARRRRGGGANYDWPKILEAWRKKREEEEEVERKRLERELEKARGAIRAREIFERDAAMEAARLDAEDMDSRLVCALIGDDDE